MADSDRSTSPDPITLPSSPVGTRSPRRRNLPPRRPASTRASPSKSIILDTGRDGTVSPWRIKVTVQAEPQEGSAGPKKPRRRGIRTTRLLLNDTTEEGGLVMAGSDMVPRDEAAAERPKRKRRGTPIRGRSKREQIQQDSVTDEEDAAGVMLSSEPPPTSSATRAHRRRSLNVMPMERSKRLSKARDELDQALQDAVGHGGTGGESEVESIPGDMTVAGNEDFTMVSVETLQSMKADTSLISNRMDMDKSAVSVSYLPSSPPRTDRETAPSVEYPDLTAAVGRMRSAAAFDQVYTAPDSAEHEDAPVTTEASEWRHARQFIDQHVEETRTDQIVEPQRAAVITNASITRVEQDQSNAKLTESGEDADIWQEEASRSFEDESQPREISTRASRRTRTRGENKTVSQDLNDLFSGTNRPSRAKIPRTWRRVSGADFTYSDSPAHDLLREDINARRDASDGSAGSRASSGVLTPPTSGDEQGRNDERGEGEQEDNSFTRPDAEATQLQAGKRHQHEEALKLHAVHDTSRADLATPLSDSGSSVANPDGEDTGLFWQSNLPQVYNRRDERPRPQRMKPMDLSDLLNLHEKTHQTESVAAAEVTAGSAHTNDLGDHDRTTHFLRRKDLPHVSKLDLNTHSSIRMQPVVGRINSSPSEGSQSKIPSSPLRKSLLRSSKLTGSISTDRSMPLSTHQLHTDNAQQENHEQEVAGNEYVTEVVDESFQSKASDQRQLLREQQSALPQHWARTERDAMEEAEYIDSSEGLQSSFYGDGEATEEPSRSYEENLNLDSPQKIQVNFNDSEGASSLLHPMKQYPPLFGSTPKPPQPSISTVTPISTKPEPPTHGLLSRLTSSLWSAVVRPTGPTEVFPAYTTRIADDVGFSPNLRVDIRSRYGVLSSTHPWTMSHMWTLHRMHNSCTSGRYDSIVPRSGPLPSFLSARVDTTQTSMAGYRWHFTLRYAHVVHAFMQTLVDASVVEAMERGDVEFLGDWLAKDHRGVVKGVKGSGPVWAKPGMGILKTGLPIEMDFVLAALGDVIREELRTQERKRKESLALEDMEG